MPGENQAIYVLMIVVLVLTSLPQLWGLILTHQDMVFSGFVYEHTFFDSFSYLAKMRVGLHGEWLYSNPYTTEEQRPVLLFVFYLLLGHVARWTALSPFVVFHAARVLLGVGLLFTADRVIRALEFRGATRIVAFVFVFSASGFAWVMRLMGARLLPPEYSYTEGYAFQSMANFPHFVLSSILILAMLLLSYRWALGRASGRTLVVLAALSFIQAWVHPRLVLTVVAVGGAAAALGHWRGHWRALKWVPPIAVVLAAAAPPMILTLISLRSDPLWSQWSSTPTLSPAPWLYLEAYGLLWPLALWGGYAAFKAGRPWGTFMVAWLVVASLLPYLPIAAQRRMIHGWNFPLALLAGYAAAERLAPWMVRRRLLGAKGANFALGGLCLLLAMSSLWYMGTGAEMVVRGDFPAYYSLNREGAMDWLRNNSEREDVILCAPLTGMFIPAMAGNTVVTGHWAETIDRLRKNMDVIEFFDLTTARGRRIEILDEHRVRFIFYGQWEADTGPYNPAFEPKLFRRVWWSPTLHIFERIE